MKTWIALVVVAIAATSTLIIGWLPGYEIAHVTAFLASLVLFLAFVIRGRQ
jgi:hypothetical protein